MDLSKMIKDLSKAGVNLYDIAVWENGTVTEHRFVTCNRCNDSYSVAKVYTMTAIGLMWEEGKVRLDQPLLSCFSEYTDKDIRPEWRKVTVENALTHRLGFARGTMDIDCEDASAYPSEDYMMNLFSMPLELEPGTTYVYTDAAYYLLSKLAGKLAGKPMDQLLYERILRHMHIKETAWSRDPQGEPIGATGLYISAEDMVKMGALYLQDGVYEGKRLIGKEWVKMAVENEYEWHPKAQGHLFMKRGMYGQGLCFSPDLGIAIAWHGCDHGEMSRYTAEYLEQTVLRMI